MSEMMPMTASRSSFKEDHWRRRLSTPPRPKTTTLPAQTVGSALVTKLAATITAIDEDLTRIDAEIADHVAHHDSAQLVLTMPGFGPVLAASFIAQIGGSLDAFDNVDRLACVAGLAPVPRDSGRINGTCTGPDGSTAGCCAPAISRHCRA
jgi:transposase